MNNRKINKCFVRRVSVIMLSLLMLLPFTVLVSLPAAAVTPTWTAGAEYKASRFYRQLTEVRLTGDMRRDVVAVALSQVGYHGGDNTAEMGGANFNGTKNFTEFNRWYGKIGGSYGYAWCAVFVSWSLRQAQVPTSVAKSAASCTTYVNWFKTNSTYKTAASGYLPTTGDIIFYSDVGSGYVSTHVGFVVGRERNYIYTVEGNANYSVMTRRYDVDDPYIVGYGVPAYTTVAGTSYDFPLEYTLYKRTDYEIASDLTLRTGPGETYTAVGTLAKGTKVNVEYSAFGWGRLPAKEIGTNVRVPLLGDPAPDGETTTQTTETLPEPPETTESGEVTTESAETSDEPGTTVTPDVTTEPGTTSTPDITTEPETTHTPDTTTEPQTTREPETTAKPEEGTVYVWFPLSGANIISDVTECTVSYDLNGGTSDSRLTNQVKSLSTTVKLHSYTPTREGYRFLGWGITKTAGVADFRAGDYYSGPDDLALYAVWEPLSCTVTFYDEDGKTVLYTGTLLYDQAVSTSLKPQKAAEGEVKYVFAGWEPALPNKIKGNMTFRATFKVWSPNDTTAAETTAEGDPAITTDPLQTESSATDPILTDDGTEWISEDPDETTAIPEDSASVPGDTSSCPDDTTEKNVPDVSTDHAAVPEKALTTDMIIVLIALSAATLIVVVGILVKIKQ